MISYPTLPLDLALVCWKGAPAPEAPATQEKIARLPKLAGLDTPQHHAPLDIIWVSSAPTLYLSWRQWNNRNTPGDDGPFHPPTFTQHRKGCVFTKELLCLAANHLGRNEERPSCWIVSYHRGCLYELFPWNLWNLQLWQFLKFKLNTVWSNLLDRNCCKLLPATSTWLARASESGQFRRFRWALHQRPTKRRSPVASNGNKVRLGRGSVDRWGKRPSVQVNLSDGFLNCSPSLKTRCLCLFRLPYHSVFSNICESTTHDPDQQTTGFPWESILTYIYINTQPTH